MRREGKFKIFLNFIELGKEHLSPSRNCVLPLYKTLQSINFVIHKTRQHVPNARSSLPLPFSQFVQDCENFSPSMHLSVPAVAVAAFCTVSPPEVLARHFPGNDRELHKLYALWNWNGPPGKQLAIFLTEFKTQCIPNVSISASRTGLLLNRQTAGLQQSGSAHP